MYKINSSNELIQNKQSRGSLTLRSVGFSYTTSRQQHTTPILEHIDLEISDGEFVCVLGPSGCGKTTLLNLVAGFHSPTQGEILLDGSAITGPSANRGVVFQGEDALFPWLTAKENVKFGLKMRGHTDVEQSEIANRYLELVHLSSHGEKFPSEMSGGMKQRVQIARILANQPQVLLMDEPFGALDAQTRSKLQTDLVQIWMKTKKTVLFITHDITEAILLSTRIVLLTKGPGSKIAQTIEVNMGHPRRRNNSRFGELWESVNDTINSEESRTSVTA